jgi:hypothetical protein
MLLQEESLAEPIFYEPQYPLRLKFVLCLLSRIYPPTVFRLEQRFKANFVGRRS